MLRQNTVGTLVWTHSITLGVKKHTYLHFQRHDTSLSIPSQKFFLDFPWSCGPWSHVAAGLPSPRARTPARRPGRAAPSGGWPTAPSAASRGQHRGDAAPAPAPAPASRFPRPGRRRLRHLPRTRKSAGGGGGARGRARRLHLAARAPGRTCPPAVLGTGSCDPRPGKALLPRGSHITTPIHCKLGARVDALTSASLLPVAPVVLSRKPRAAPS